MSAVSHAIRERIAQQAQFRCGYCVTQERISGVPLTVEHLIPRSKGGNDTDENLWMSCRLCNEAKGVLVDAHDPETDTIVTLFNPRIHAWNAHFVWSVSGTEVIGTTAIGRATVQALALNSDFRVRARTLWVEVGWHPPE